MERDQHTVNSDTCKSCVVYYILYKTLKKAINNNKT